MLGHGRVEVGTAGLSEVVLAIGDSSEVEDSVGGWLSAGGASPAEVVSAGGVTPVWVTAWLVVKTEVSVAVTGQIVVLIATT